MPIFPLRGTFLLVVLASGGIAAGEAITLQPIADTCLWELDPDLNFGRQRELPGGVLGLMGDSRRARVLYKYELAGAVPDGAVIESARMKLSISAQVPESGRRASDFALNRVLADWGEGDGFGERPGGRAALPGEATWNHRFHPEAGEGGLAWSQPGGAFGIDFAAGASAVAENIDGNRQNPTSYFFEFNAAGIADLQGMVEGTMENYGWVLHTLSESTRKTARRWTSHETLNEGPLPELEIRYALSRPEPPPLISVAIDEASGELVVRVDALEGHRYQLQCGDNLTTWDLGEVRVPDQDGELIFRVGIDGREKYVQISSERIEEEEAVPPAPD